MVTSKSRRKPWRFSEVGPFVEIPRRSGQERSAGAQTAVNRSFTTGKNMAWIPQNIMGREYVRPVEDDGANNLPRVEYLARPRDGAS